MGIKLKTRYFSIIGIVLFIGILSRVDVGAVLTAVRHADAWFLFLGALTIVAEVLLRTEKWRAVVLNFADKYSFRQSFATYLIGIAFGSVTPGKVGDAIKIIDLKEKTGIGYEKGIGVEVLDRIVDILFLFIMSGIGLVYVLMVISGVGGSYLYLFALVVAAIALAFFSLSEGFVVVLRPLFRFLVPERFKDRARFTYKEFRESVKVLKGSQYLGRIVLLTGTGWWVLFIRPWFFLQAIGIEGPLFAIFILMPLVTVIELLPISIMGFGTREAMMISLFGLFGLSPESMVTVSLLMVIFSILPQMAVGYWFASKKHINTEGYMG